MIKGKIGLEIHVYLITNEKLFCRCINSREKGLKKNVNICPICTGQPGAKPMMPNEEAVKKAVSIGLMLGCKINNKLVWQRKHYEWPDMPKGYQNTISGAGAIPVGVNGKYGGIGIWSMHLEEDPASWDPKTGCIDYNRSGVPLVEIVTAPDFESSEEVMQWLRKLIHSLSYLKVADSNAGIKADVNVNIPGKTERVEIKNISSIEDIGRAVDYEIERQLVEGSERETRRFDSVKGKTARMRGKEEAADYRFISDPDLIDIVIDKKIVSKIEKDLPESPEEKLKKLVKNYKIDKKNAEILARNIDIVEFFEEVIKKIDVKFALPWINGELMRFLNYNKTILGEVNISVEHFVNLLNLVKNGKITELQGKKTLDKFYPKSFDPSKEVKEKISNEEDLERIIKKVMGDNAKAVEDYLAGEEKSFNYLMGMVMKVTERRADFKVASVILKKLLSD